MSPARCAHRGFSLDLLAVRCEVGVRYTQLPKSSRAQRACTVPRKGRPRSCSAFAKQKLDPLDEAARLLCDPVLMWQ